MLNTAKKLINGDTYRRISDERLAEILIKDTCSFNNSTRFKDNQQIVLDDLKLKIHLFETNQKGLYIRKSNTSADIWANICMNFLRDEFNFSSITYDRSNTVGQICKKRLSQQYIFKHIEMVHIIEAPKNPILYGWIGNIAAISKPNKAYTDTGTNGFGRETARLLWQKDQFSYIPDSVEYYNDFIKQNKFSERIISWTKLNGISDQYQLRLLTTFSTINLN